MIFKKSQQEIDTTSETIEKLLTRGVEEVFVLESIKKKLQTGKPLRIKLGIDPTGTTIHIGRAITLWKLRYFQEAGHTIVFIVGDFTAQIGDASDKLEKRPMLARAKIEENLKNYKKIIGKIIDVSKAEFLFNSTWLKKLGFQEISELAETFTVQQMSNRRNFADRIERGEEVSLREFLYPLMQGYDSVAVKADVEIGGFDQLFNLKAGRTIQKHYGMTEQDILITGMLEGTDGRKMSTSWGNVINITDEANDMYGKVMSVRDELITKYFLLCTRISESEIETIKKELADGKNPRDAKMRLAREIVALYHSQESAQKSEENFINTFKKGEIPDDAPEIKPKIGILLSDILLQEKIVSSKTEFRRLIDEKAISIVGSDEKISDPFYKIEKSVDLKIGKRRFIKIRI